MAVRDVHVAEPRPSRWWAVTGGLIGAGLAALWAMADGGAAWLAGVGTVTWGLGYWASLDSRRRAGFDLTADGIRSVVTEARDILPWPWITAVVLAPDGTVANRYRLVAITSRGYAFHITDYAHPIEVAARLLEHVREAVTVVPTHVRVESTPLPTPLADVSRYDAQTAEQLQRRGIPQTHSVLRGDPEDDEDLRAILSDPAPTEQPAVGVDSGGGRWTVLASEAEHHRRALGQLRHTLAEGPLRDALTRATEEADGVVADVRAVAARGRASEAAARAAGSGSAGRLWAVTARYEESAAELVHHLGHTVASFAEAIADATGGDLNDVAVAAADAAAGLAAAHRQFADLTAGTAADPDLPEPRGRRPDVDGTTATG